VLVNFRILLNPAAVWGHKGFIIRTYVLIVTRGLFRKNKKEIFFAILKIFFKKRENLVLIGLQDFKCLKKFIYLLTNILV